MNKSSEPKRYEEDIDNKMSNDDNISKDNKMSNDKKISIDNKMCQNDIANKNDRKNSVQQTLQLLKNDIRSLRWVIPALILYFVLIYIVFGTICPIKGITGIPCPGCGMSRALGLLMRGRFAASFQMHPLLGLWLLYLLYLILMRYLYRRKPKGMIPFLIVLCVAMFAVYIYRMVTLFPNQEPMTYGRQSQCIMMWWKM